MQALAYADSTLYVLTGSGSNVDGALHTIRIANGLVTTISLPSARAMDVSGDVLWLAGNLYVEKRNLSDTTLIARYDISSYFTGSNNWIQGMSVAGDTVHLMASWNQFLTVSSEGTLLRSDSSYAGLDDMTVVEGRLWGCSTSRHIHEIDPVTLHATHTYHVAGGVFGVRFQGIAAGDGKIFAADFAQNHLSIWTMEIP